MTGFSAAAGIAFINSVGNLGGFIGHKLHRLEENLGAANVDLTPEDLCAIESASSNIKVEGARYPQWLEPISGR